MNFHQTLNLVKSWHELFLISECNLVGGYTAFLGGNNVCEECCGIILFLCPYKNLKSDRFIKTL